MTTTAHGDVASGTVSGGLYPSVQWNVVVSGVDVTLNKLTINTSSTSAYSLQIDGTVRGTRSSSTGIFDIDINYVLTVGSHIFILTMTPSGNVRYVSPPYGPFSGSDYTITPGHWEQFTPSYDLVFGYTVTSAGGVVGPPNLGIADIFPMEPTYLYKSYVDGSLSLFQGLVLGNVDGIFVYDAKHGVKIPTIGQLWPRKVWQYNDYLTAPAGTLGYANRVYDYYVFGTIRTRIQYGQLWPRGDYVANSQFEVKE